jgi:transposase-like protein
MRREFSKEFKRDAFSLFIDQRYSQVDTAKSLGIHSALLSRWVREIARLTSTTAGTLHRELSKLAKANVLLRELSGNQVYYCCSRLVGLNRWLSMPPNVQANTVWFLLFSCLYTFELLPR